MAEFIGVGPEVEDDVWTVVLVPLAAELEALGWRWGEDEEKHEEE